MAKVETPALPDRWDGEVPECVLAAALDRDFSPRFKVEGFTFWTSCWDVAKAWDIVNAWTPEVRKERLATGNVKPGCSEMIRTDDAKAMECDLTVPILLITIEHPEDLLTLTIDGWHRVRKAELLGMTALPAFRLNLEESASVKIGAKPQARRCGG